MDKIFFEIHRDLPREGPGDPESTRRAFSLLEGVPPAPRILDIGCGPGAQTLMLAELTEGSITAIDNHRPFLHALDRKRNDVEDSEKIQPVCGDMHACPFAENAFDVIWSEGAVYIIGLADGLTTWRPYLKDHGSIAVTEISWLRPDPPSELRTYWDEAYPAMLDISGNLDIIKSCGYKTTGHFTLPDQAWDNYYGPLENRIGRLIEKYKNDEAALRMLHSELKEIELYNKYHDDYGYVFYVMKTMENA